ncbi:hypothetical protein JYT16_01160 [Gemmatimonas aurantiaca]|nr:hypothetical protein [Gemmatimonas aurantiaca]
MAEAYPYPNPAPIPSNVSSDGSYPRRMGKPRSFWTVLGLGIITFGIYFVVYHFIVALELRDSMRWREEDDYSPTAFLWFYSAYIFFLLVAPIFIGIIIAITALPEILSAGGDFDINTVPYFVKFQSLLVVYGIFTTALGFYITYYFLRLNDIAAGKVNATRLGVTIPVIAFAVFYFFNFISDLAESIFGVSDVDVSGMENMGGATFLALIGLGFLMIGFAFFIFGVMFYAYWRQTELVNHVWLSGDFGDQPADPTNHLSDTATTPPTITT